jgi:hypothetical protein
MSILTLFALAAALTVLPHSAKGQTTILSNIERLAQTVAYNPLVPLTHCMLVGTENEIQIEWSLNGAPKPNIEIRYTTAKAKGFSSVGFANENDMQLVTGYPTEDLACARTLFDSYTVYDIDGNSYPDFPEVPAQVVWTDDYTVKHYVMRNLSITAARTLSEGGSIPVNMTVLWSYYMASLYSGGCYGVNTMPFTEAATYHVDLNDPRYLHADAAVKCRPYQGSVKPYRYIRPIHASIPMLDGEIQQNHRATALLIGGGMLLSTAKKAPLFNGRVLGGEQANGVCSNSLTNVQGQWYGFSDKVGGIVRYLVSVGTAAKPSLYYSAVDVGTNLAFSQAATLTPNVSYIVTVEAFNFAGLSTTVISKPVTVLGAGSPIFGRMYSGTLVPGTTVRYQQGSTSLSFVWTRWVTEEHAAKNYYTGAYTENGYEYALGITGGNVEAVIPFTSVAHWESYRTISGLQLVNGVTYSLTIRSINCATEYTTQTSPGITIDYSGPLPGTVIFGNQSSQTVPVITRHQYIRASWFGFYDILSGVASYEWAVSTYRRPPSPSTNTYMTIPWTSVGLLTHAVSTSKVSGIPAVNSLPYGTKLYVHVKAVDAVGNWVVQTSNSSTLVTL